MDFGASQLRMGYITPRLAWDSGISPAINSFSRDDSAVANSALALTPTQRARRRMTGGSVASVSVAYASVPDLSVVINRAGGFAFEYWLMYFTSDVAEGIGVQLAFSGVANGVGYSVEAYTDPSTRAPLVVATDFGTGLAPYAAGPGAVNPCVITVRGSCFVATPGQLDLQIRAETGGANSATLMYPSWANAGSS